jgi:serine-type D-Ala-D-Ala carboxypeptidase/endopeptidase (penicillin-binding protein 4)
MVRLLIFILLLSCVACSSLSKRRLTKTFQTTEANFQDHVGFVLYDPELKKQLFEYNAAQYFTPASNTKIFTFFASLKILGDSIPALKYSARQDSLIFWGTGDPSFFSKNVFTNDRTYNFLRAAPQALYFSTTNFNTTNFGPGWAWDDYNDYYLAERSPLPLYGNVFSIYSHQDTLTLSPIYFRSLLHVGERKDKPKAIREQYSNESTYYPSFQRRKFTADIPFKVDPTLSANLLSDTLKRKVQWIEKAGSANATIVYSIPADSLYKEMMQESDNFIAEQLLLICSGILSDTLQPEIAIEYVKKNYLTDLKDEPIWVDGSGLSRYNLFTPRSIVELWDKIYTMVPRERLFPLLATGGKNGTIRNWYKNGTPYIFGKTGSLSNNHCLSGYLVAKSGRVLIFSFMNSNFVQSTSDVRKNMQNILNEIYTKY